MLAKWYISLVTIVVANVSRVYVLAAQVNLKVVLNTSLTMAKSRSGRHGACVIVRKQCADVHKYSSMLHSSAAKKHRNKHDQQGKPCSYICSMQNSLP